MLDVVGTQTDDTCITSLERNLISLMEDSSSIFDISLEEWQNYQPCIENSESTSLHYEIIEDILDFVKHPHEFKSGVYLIRIMNEKYNTFEGALKIVKR